MSLSYVDVFTDRAIRVLVIEDHRMVADTLRSALILLGFDVAVSSCGGIESILQEAAFRRPDLVVLNPDLDAIGDGRALIQPLSARGVAVLVLSATGDRVRLAECIEAGAVGVVTKAETFTSVLAKILAAVRGDEVMSESERLRYIADLRTEREEQRKRQLPFESLTPRERQVLAMILNGVAAQGIASQFFVSVATVRTQIQSILNKLGVNSQAAAVAMARHAGWSGER